MHGRRSVISYCYINRTRHHYLEWPDLLPLAKTEAALAHCEACATADLIKPHHLALRNCQVRHHRLTWADRQLRHQSHQRELTDRPPYCAIAQELPSPSFRPIAKYNPGPISHIRKGKTNQIL